MPSLIVAVLFGLFTFGVLFNLAVEIAERRGWLEGYTALAVVAGVIVTLAGVALIDWRAAAISLICFIASGTPMVIGSAWRYIRAREKAQQNDRQAATLADDC